MSIEKIWEMGERRRSAGGQAELAAKNCDVRKILHALELVQNLGYDIVARGEGTMFPGPLRTTDRYISYPLKY